MDLAFPLLHPQSGGQIEFKTENGSLAMRSLRARFSLTGSAPLGVITADKHVQWSNGTEWRKM